MDLMQAPSMERQPFCALPWCGKTGKIDAHHVIPRSQGGAIGPLVYICHECHMKHHGEHPLDFDYDPDQNDEGWGVWEGPEWNPLVIYDETRDQEALCAEELLDWSELDEMMHLHDAQDYLIGLDLADKDKRVGNRRELAEMVAERYNISENAVEGWISKRINYASLPKKAACLGITKGYLVFQLTKAGHDFNTVYADLCSMPRSQFNAQYGKAPAVRRTCTTCVHDYQGAS